LEKLEDGMRPDLIFLDVMMPRNDGWAICRKIKTNDIFKDIFICMLTVRDTSEDIKKSLEVGQSGTSVSLFQYQSLWKQWIFL
jgi:CheY-like chemotaxis protein